MLLVYIFRFAKLYFELRYSIDTILAFAYALSTFFYHILLKNHFSYRKEFSQMINTINTPSFETATGPIDYCFTNDYMFRAILQKNKRVLKALICALLHLSPDTVVSVLITNPIELGDSIDDKDFILDIHVLLNNNTCINLEMQVKSQPDWEERSLSYLCRTYDQLTEGENYINAKAAIHIGILDFTPFPDYPEFYASHKLLNIKNQHVYSDKFILNVLDLTKIALATDEDKAHQIDYWASLFKSRTWEELRMISEKNENLREASETLYQLNADDITRQKCRAREDYYRMQRKTDRIIETLTAENESLKKLLDEHGIKY